MDTQCGGTSPSGTSRILALAVVMLAGALAASAGRSPSPAGAAGRPTAPLAPADGALFGAHVQAGSGVNPYVAVEELEGKLGRRLAIDHYYRTWEAAFPDGREEWDAAAGRIPMISWGKTSTSGITNGSQDELIRQRARGIRAFGQFVFVRWFWEMGGNRNAATAVSPAEYIAAWQRLHRIFAEEGATNALWVWCPDASDFADGVAQSFYPGDDTVDWTCADGYNYRHPARRSTQARSFEDTFSAFYTWAVDRTHKPIMIGEYGAVEDGPGDKARWVDASRAVLKTRYPAIGAVVYFHSLRERDGFTYDWRMDTSPESLAAFAAQGGDPSFNPPVVRSIPDTTVEAGPEGLVGSADATFTFSASQPAESFECRLDGGAFDPCSSPAAYPGLAEGGHAFEVRAVGGFGRADTSPARREWSVDVTAPTIAKVEPPDGATGVPTDSAISVTFSEEIDPASVRGDAFTLVAESAGGGPVAVTVAYDPTTRTATLDPGGDLNPLQTYRVAVAAGAVADRAANRLAADRTWRFTAGAALPLPIGPPR